MSIVAINFQIDFFFLLDIYSYRYKKHSGNVVTVRLKGPHLPKFQAYPVIDAQFVVSRYKIKKQLAIHYIYTSMHVDTVNSIFYIGPTHAIHYTQHMDMCFINVQKKI